MIKALVAACKFSTFLLVLVAEQAGLSMTISPHPKEMSFSEQVQVNVWFCRKHIRSCMAYSKTCVKRPLNNRQNQYLNGNW